MVIVLKMQGKGSHSSADKVSVHILDCYTLAQEFIKKNTVDAKYWSYCEVVEEGETIETYPEFD